MLFLPFPARSSAASSLPVPQVVAWPEELAGANAIVRSLRDLFLALEAEEQRRLLGGSGSVPSSPVQTVAQQPAAPVPPARPERSVVNPTPLREALSESLRPRVRALGALCAKLGTAAEQRLACVATSYITLPDRRCHCCC